MNGLTFMFVPKQADRYQSVNFVVMNLTGGNFMYLLNKVKVITCG